MKVNGDKIQLQFEEFIKSIVYEIYIVIYNLYYSLRDIFKKSILNYKIQI